MNVFEAGWIASPIIGAVVDDLREPYLATLPEGRKFVVRSFMKTLWGIVIGLSLAIAATGQLQPPPPITSAQPPLNPNIAPAIPQPGVATDATGASAFNAPSGSVAGSSGRPTFSTPFPVVMPAGSLSPANFCSLGPVRFVQMLP